MALLLLLLVALAPALARASRPLEGEGIALVTDRLSLPDDFALLGNGLDAQQFKDFVASYNKKYQTVSELRHRFAAFQESLSLINANSNAQLTYTLGLNEFADLTWEEFKKEFLGAPQDCSATKGNHVKSNRVLPKKKDWREQGIVSPVKSQGGCGSCWTFSTTGALEAAWTQKTGEKVSLAEQQLVDCAGDFNNFGCMGGLPSQAYEYIMYAGGLDKSEAYRYTGVDGECKFKPDAIGATVKSAVNITEFDEEELTDAVAFMRPVSIAYEVVSDFRLYKNGVYTSTACHTGSQTVNHAVTAVGYNTEGLLPHFIVKNSWGTTWGEDGYFNIEMGKNMCGIATCASYPNV